ncbi:MAG: molybdopterin-guanine dinucleotide biosynthesis protein [Clostridiales bacterium]|nr:molybdopterin-guanine dinucleotide biosynthesis protein [Clostridiales bacterium]
MKAISMVGFSKSGKTTACEAAISELTKRGYKVGSVKNIHKENFSLDDPTSNTGRHRAAGAYQTIARCPDDTAILLPHTLTPRELIRQFDCDYLILEGVRDVLCPVIQFAKTAEDLPAVPDPRTVAYAGVLANTGLTELNGMPVLNPLKDAGAFADFIEQHAFAPLPDVEPECCGKCGSDCPGFCADVISGKRDRDECAQYDQSITLRVGGKQLHLVPFVERILRNTLIGIVKELEGYEEGGEVTITFGGGR